VHWRRREREREREREKEGRMEEIKEAPEACTVYCIPNKTTTLFLSKQ